MSNEPLLSIRLASEHALYLDIAREPSPAALAMLVQLEHQLKQHYGHHLRDVVPAYLSLLLIFEAESFAFEPLCRELKAICRRLLQQPPAELAGKKVELPVYYGKDSGPDLARVAALHQLSQKRLIELHHSTAYLVYAIGFAPGFAYLGFVPEQIYTPRLSTPRQQVHAGSVGIADRQTAVYPASSPGGWNIIGNCPLPLFDPTASPLMPVAVGDEVQFVPIERNEFIRLGGQLWTD
ncbi:5-oxoprolinase subunit PxpB [Rheinheimera sp.]|uniref:5-oxoprolinase subunit PxpB n=1 Tax=Rheinheimera sp. TaxID=1869214 RepID=UPI0027B95100|nr:5-oxoprolinase subunit PxpB [Rheinheimera sp.]